MDRIPFEYLKIDTSRGLKDHEVKVEGRGIIVLNSPVEAYAKINSQLADPIPLVSIEQIDVKVQKLYLTSPPSITPIELLIIKDAEIAVDANSQYKVAARTGMFLSYLLLASAQRGNYSKTYEIDYTRESTIVQELYQVGPYLIDNIVGITLLTEGAGWQVTINSVHPYTGEILTSTYDLSELSKGDRIEHIGYQAVFVPVSATQNLKVEVSYLYIPIWR